MFNDLVEKLKREVEADAENTGYFSLNIISWQKTKTSFGDG